MAADEDFVETSDVEELAEFERDLRLSRESSPVTYRLYDPPRKRIKLCHRQEQVSPEQPMHDEVFLSSSQTAPVIGSPTASQLFSSPSQNRTSPVVELSLPKLSSDEVLVVPYILPLRNLQDSVPLNLVSQAADSISSQVSPRDSPFFESRVDLPMDITTEDTVQEQESTTPPDTPNSAYQSSHYRSPSPDPLVLQENITATPSKDLSRSLPKTYIPYSTYQYRSTLFDSPDITSLSDLSRNLLQTDKTVDELLLFSPIKPSGASSKAPSPPPIKNQQPWSTINVSSTPLSDNTRSSSPQQSPSTSTLLRAAPTAPAQSLHRNIQDDLAALAEEQQSSRYSFRKRNAAQLAPYTADLIEYKRALRSNPDAIIKMKQIERQLEQQHLHKHPDDHYEEDQYANDLDPAEDADWEERERRRKRRLEKAKEVSPERDLTHYPAILQDMLSTDDEEKEMDAASKEARKILRAKERERKAREKEEERRRREEAWRERRSGNGQSKEKEIRPKPYPVSKPKSFREGSVRRSPEKHGTVEHEATGHSRYSSPPLPSFHSRSNGNINGASTNEDNIIHGYFDDVDFELYGAEDGQDDQSRTPDEDAIELPSDCGEDVVQQKSSDIPKLEIIGLDRKRQRILGRVMPPGMAVKLAQENATKAQMKERLFHSPVPDAEDVGPLLPGQTRVRKAVSAKDIQDIRGDSESGADHGPEYASSSSSDESDSDSDSVEILQSYRPPPRPKVEEPEFIFDDTDSDGDEDIQFFVQNTRPARKLGHKPKLRDQSLINYMLPRVYTTGGTSRKRTNGQSGKRHSKYKFDIMTKDSRGQGRERQTLLSFDEHGIKKRGHSARRTAIMPGSSGSNSKPPLTRTASKGMDDTLFDGVARQVNMSPQRDHRVQVVQDQRQLSRKEREKLRKARARKHGIYNFASRGQSRITNWRRADAAFFTVDLEDEGFHRALAPVSASGPWYEPPPPKKRKSTSGRTMSGGALFEPPPPQDDNSSVYEDGQALGASGGNLKNITGDLNIKRLHSGRSFGQSTYIRKGWLHDLINVATGTSDNTVPPSTILCRFELSTTIGVATFCLTLPKLLDTLFEAATDILDADSDTLSDEWKPSFRVASQLVSWYLQNCQETEKTTIQETIEKEVSRIANLIDKHSTNFVEKPILSLCWFLVELSARASVPLPALYTGLSSSIKTASKVLIQLLLRFGINKTADVIRNDTNLDEPSLVHYATELWVCLIHLFGTPKGATPKSKLNPFWTVLMDALPTVPIKDSSQSFKASEDVWITIFTLSALSQFSVHGMVTAAPRLPAYWDLVAFGLKTICLTETDDHQRLQSPVLRKRDRYVGLIVNRCSYLHDTWQWRLDEGSSMFNQLSEIFRSRNFANLRFENDNLPKFFKHTDWNRLQVHDSKDTVFSAFLKLIMLADRDEVNVGRKSAKLKKLLSLAVPLRPLSFSTSRPPTGRDLSMFYNRLCAIALALYLDQSDHDDRINKARNYIDFNNADPTTKHAVLCGLERLALLMVKRDISLGAMLDWIEELSKTVESDLKNFLSKSSGQSSDEIQMAAPVRLVKHLLMTVGNIAKSYANLSRFPDPHLPGKLKHLLGSPTMKHEVVRDSFALALDMIFTARLKSLPKAVRPFSFEEVSEESQNYFEGFDDIDFTALDDLPGNDHASNILQKDQVFRQGVDAKLKWMVYSHLRPYLESSPPPTVSLKAYANECDKWLRLWLCFNDLQQTESNKWDNPIQLLDNVLKPGATAQDNDKDESWVYRVNLSIMFQLLQLEPMAYLSYMDRALQIFFLALVSDTLTLENQYVSYLLSIDCLRHSLFVGAAAFLPVRVTTSADYEFAPEQFLDLRLPLIGVIFQNIERSLSDHEVEGRTTFVDLCYGMFSRMRRVRSLLLQRSGEEAEKVILYQQFCVQVLQAFQEHPLLRSQDRLAFFVGWVRTLAAPHR